MKNYILFILCLSTLTNLHLGQENAPKIPEEKLKFLEWENIEDKQIESFLQRKDSEKTFFLDGSKGYNSYQDTLASESCYKVASTSISDPFSDLTLSQSYKKSDFYDHFDYSFGVILFFINVAGSYERTFIENRNSFTFYYYAYYKRTKNFKYDLDVSKFLDSDFHETLEDSKENKDDEFVKQCGDHVLTSLTEGGLIQIQVKVDVVNKDYVKNFQLAFSLGVPGLVSLYLGVKEQLRQASIEGSISFKADQLGGEALRINSLFQDNDSMNACADSVNFKLEDSKEKTQRCLRFLENIYKYVNEDFPAQFKNEKENLWTFGYTLAKPNLNMDFNLKYDLPLLKSLRLKIKKLIDLNNYYTNGLDQFSGKFSKSMSYPAYDDIIIEELEKIKNFAEQLKKNNIILTEPNSGFSSFKFNDCWNNIDNCTEDNFNKQMQKLYTTYEQIDKFMETYKYSYHWKLVLTDFAEVFTPTLEIRSYPIGNSKFTIKVVGGNYIRNEKFDRWQLSNPMNVNNFNKFSFQLNEKKILMVNNVKSEPLKISIFITGVHKMPIVQKDEGIQILNSHYFSPKTLLNF